MNENGLQVFVTHFLVHQIPNPIQRIDSYFFHSSEVFKGNPNAFLFLITKIQTNNLSKNEKIQTNNWVFF